MIPVGEVMVPVPLPDLVTVRPSVFTVKVAVTVLAASTVTTQSPVPVQPLPPHPVKVELLSGWADKVTTFPALKKREQVGLQSIPAGAEEMLPVPFPALTTVREKVWVPKLAVMDLLESTVTLQEVPVLLLQPDQPEKVAFGSGDAVRVTVVPIV